MNSSLFGTLSNVDSGTSKFFASTSFGVWCIHSVNRKVPNSLKLPSLNTSRNLHPSSPRPWMECGTPPGNNHRSPACTSSTNARPCWSTAVIRAEPYSISAHSDATCQCSSRMPPEISRISTPAIVLEIGRSRTVTCRVQPPPSIRLCESENEYLNGGCPPESVSGGHTESWFWPSRTVLFFGPGWLSLTPVWVSVG